MRLLVTGRGGSGSWKIRGDQLGAALGAVVRPNASFSDCADADAIVVVKRVPDDLLGAIRKSGRPWAYDIVDAYPQPACSEWGKRQSIDWLRNHIGHLRPDVVIWPNARMRDDAGMAGPVVYHHHRAGIATNPIRDRIQSIGYEGAEAYLDGWMPEIKAQCRLRGWRFVVNPKHLADVDIVLAVRGGQWCGYPQQHWKSNVKLANAHGSGTPFIGLSECGYMETAAGGEEFVRSPKDLGDAFDALSPVVVRRQISDGFRRCAITLDAAASQLREALCGLKS